MKLPSYLVRNRHGIFYFRLTYLVDSARKEKRWSLRTRNPVEAKRMSLQLSAALRQNAAVQNQESGISSYQAADACSIGQLLPMDNGVMAINNNFRQLVTVFTTPTGNSMKMKVDQSDPKDVAAGEQMVIAFLQADATLANQFNQEGILANQLFDSPSSFPPSAGQSLNIENPSSETIQASIERFETRQKERLTEKTLYEYGNMQRKFAEWLSTKKNTNFIYTESVKRADIADFIDYLKNGGISLQTIQKKYLAALNGLLELAQDSGAYPLGDLPTKNHKIYTHREKKKARVMSEKKFFDDEDLVKIFNPNYLLARAKPCDYWLPLLGLFTGARITELCQLNIGDIKQVNGIWAVDINDDGNKTVKTVAGIREIPLHPQLIELGFLDYLDDVRPYGGTIFPYLNPDKYGHYGKTPGRRFGEFLDTLGFTDECKVFHSFRSTCNNRLKQNDVPEERRCQYIGHEHDTVNSTIYSKKHDVQFLLVHVASKLTFPSIDFSQLTYPKEKIRAKLAHLMKVATRQRGNKKANALRD